MKHWPTILVSLAVCTGAAAAEGDKALATFAGGCFWCVEQAFDEIEGVTATVSGFAGGERENPAYEDVARGETRHVEAVQITYDPDVVGYGNLLSNFWHNVDPFDDGGQFCDRGFQYTTAIFTHNDEQARLAEASKEKLAERFDREIVTRVTPFTTFYSAAENHQNYHEKNPWQYKLYKTACGRHGRLEEVWGEDAGQPTPLAPGQP